MRPDLSELEHDLQRLSAAPLDERLLARLAACGDGTMTQIDPLEAHFEQRLRACQPAPLPAKLEASLENILTSVPFPAAGTTIVRFPGRNTNTMPARRQRNWWPAAAAAVALFGAFAGWHLPHATNPATSAANDKAPPPPAQLSAVPQVRPGQPSAATTALTPASFHRGLSAASDEGVIWQTDRQPHRVLKFIYQERVTLKDDAGRTYQVEQPRVEYLIVPAKTD